MAYVGSYFGMGIGKDMMIIFLLFVGLFIGLHRKIFSSTIILLFIYFGSLFSQGNGKIYTVLLGFIIGLYISKKIINFLKNRMPKKFILFFV